MVCRLNVSMAPPSHPPASTGAQAVRNILATTNQHLGLSFELVVHNLAASVSSQCMSWRHDCRVAFKSTLDSSQLQDA